MRLTRPDRDLFYTLSGPRDAPLVALGHNFAATSEIWAAQLPALRDYRVLRWDMRGHGQSALGATPCRFTDVAGDLVAILDELNAPTCHYCGVSMGGMVGQHLALAFPDRVSSLALVNTTSSYDMAQREAWDQRVDRVNREGVAPLHDELMARWFAPASLDAKLPGVGLMSDAYLAFSPDGFTACASMIRDMDTTERLGEITCPTLIVAGALDPATPPVMSEVLREGIDDSRMYVVDNVAHLCQVEAPERLNALYTAFLRDVT
ncbi:MAG: alpha/beta fold hydrolase [Pseudomonadota bacterium]